MAMDRNAKTPDMSVDVTLGEFHDTHEHAGKALEEMRKKSLKSFSKKELRQMLQTLEAAQALTDAETGDDAWCAMSYTKDIGAIKNQLKK